MINAYCDDLRSDAKLTADEVILQVNDVSTQEIDEYENMIWLSWTKRTLNY